MSGVEADDPLVRGLRERTRALPEWLRGHTARVVVETRRLAQRYAAGVVNFDQRQIFAAIAQRPAHVRKCGRRQRDSCRRRWRDFRRR